MGFIFTLPDADHIEVPALVVRGKETIQGK